MKLAVGSSPESIKTVKFSFKLEISWMVKLFKVPLNTVQDDVVWVVTLGSPISPENEFSSKFLINEK